MAQTKGKQIRFRVSEAQDDHLRKGAQEAGYDELSAYLRDVLLAKTVVAVHGHGIILIPAAKAGKEQREEVQALLGRILSGIEEPGQTQPSPSGAASGRVPGAPTEEPPPGEGVGGAQTDTAAGAAPAPPTETAPGEGDGSVGASPSPPAPSSSSPSDSNDRGSAAEFPPGPEQPSADQLAAADAVSGSLEGEAGVSMPSPATLGPVLQPGEDGAAYIERRTSELRLEGRPIVVAGYEAEAEWRRIAASALEQAVADQGAPAIPSPPTPTPGPIPCHNCGALKRNPGPCPDCGAA